MTRKKRSNAPVGEERLFEEEEDEREEEVEDAPATEAQLPPREKKDLSPTLLQRTFERVTVSGEGARDFTADLVPRKRITFEMDGSECAPGIFVDETGDPVTFTLTLASLTSGMESKVTRGVMDPSEASYLTVKASIEKLNGAPVLGDQLEFLWEALGAQGRQLVMQMYMHIGNVSPVAAKKAMETLSISS